MEKVTGSSPRVWGALTRCRLTVFRRRLIPTCVGSTCWAILSACAWAAHPHVCGEHSSVRASKSTLFGSSPRVWGAQEGRSDGAPAPRLIPTCVGSTDITHYNSPENSAHPHVCGEHSHQSALVGVCGGSSPRVWGAPRLIRGRGRFLRLIPTCVGSTLCCGCECHFLTAHPHVCGEHRIARGHPR